MTLESSSYTLTHALGGELMPVLAQAGSGEALHGAPLVAVIIVVTLIAIAIVYSILKRKREEAEAARKPKTPPKELTTDKAATRTEDLVEQIRKGDSDEFDRVLSDEEVAALPLAKLKRYRIWVSKHEGERVSAKARTEKAKSITAAIDTSDEGSDAEDSEAEDIDESSDGLAEASEDIVAAVSSGHSLPSPAPLSTLLRKSDVTDDAESDGEDAQDGADEAAEAVETKPEPTPEPTRPTKKPKKPRAEEPATAPTPEPTPSPRATPPVEEETGVAMTQGLERTRAGFGSKLRGFFSGGTVDEDLMDDIEEFLYEADVGVSATDDIIESLHSLSAEEKADPNVVWEFLYDHVLDILRQREAAIDWNQGPPFVLLVVGVNGAGKTTTIGKLAHQLRRKGKSVLMVAGDTFRAGAVDQLAVWADRNDIPLHEGKHEQDPASVVFEGITRGVEEGFDIVICDTSGRLHTNKNLMAELKKIERVSNKALGGAPHETILVLDANTGQNAVQQAKTFGEALDLTGLVLTKLDGTARGGVILGIGMELNIPVRYIGIGEGIYDLRPFHAEEFAEALFL